MGAHRNRVDVADTIGGDGLDRYGGVLPFRHQGRGVIVPSVPIRREGRLGIESTDVQAEPFQ